MRRKDESLRIASREIGTRPTYVLHHLRNAARREGQPNPLHRVGGKWVASPSDNLKRSKLLLTEKGYVRIIVKGSEKAAELSRFNTIASRLVHPERYAKNLGLTKDEIFQQALDDLKEFKGKRIAGKKYLTDPEAIFRLADAGVLEDEKLGSDQVRRGGRR